MEQIIPFLCNLIMKNMFGHLDFNLYSDFEWERFAVTLIFDSSKDGAIKIWTEDEALLTEIMLDDSLTSACFLNNMGDLVVGFQKQVFYIDHSKGNLITLLPIL